MKKALNPICLMFLFCLATSAGAQSDYSVLLRTGETLFPENVKGYAQTATIGAEEMIGDHYYRLLQFYEIPNKDVWNKLSQQGIELLEYIPHLTYLASIPVGFNIGQLEQSGVRSIQSIQLDLKMSDALKNGDLPDYAIRKNRVLAMLKFYKNIDHATALRYCAADGIDILMENGYNNFLRVAFPLERIDEIAALPYVAFLETVPAPSTPDDDLGRSLHRSNSLDSEYPSGRHYNGTGINMLVRDDGIVGPHIDFKGRIDNSMVTADGFDINHGDGVGGIMGGAGNINPRVKGMAPGSFLYVLDYEEDFLDETMDLFFDHNVLVTNSSYSNVCNAGYTEITETVDQQLYNNPSLMHVFSAGNSNPSDCGYGAGSQWGNITGGHKQAKNCLTTANINAESVLNSSSSRGPAHDGRIKPDIAAYGTPQESTDENNQYQEFGGTSAASPGIAGVMAQLHQAYQELNQGEVADASLLKACILNTANDLGNPGPDFKFGWGHVNAYRAVLTLEDHRYFKDEVVQGGANIHPITVPDNVLQMRVMVYWSDPEGTVLTSKALVNNLDATLQIPGTSYFPWKLNPAPNPTTLDAPATKGTDNLNNMEQIAVDNPAAGDYNLVVQGTEIPFGSHAYYVVWEFRTAEVTVTHPMGGESFEPGEKMRIHWDAQGTTDGFDIVYSTDGGTTFNPITTVNGNTRMYDWTLPNEITGKAIVKVSRGANAGQSVAPFSIAPMPTNVEVIQACPDYLRVKWSPVDLAGASATTSYEVLSLGDKYMEPKGTTDATEFDLPITQSPWSDHWIAVRAIGDDGLKSERTIAILYNGGLLDCLLDNDISIVAVSPGAGNVSICGSTDFTVTAQVQNAGTTPQSNVAVAYQFDNNPLVEETIPGPINPGEIVTHTFSQTIVNGLGDHTLLVYASITNDQATFNDTIYQQMTISSTPLSAIEPLDYAEDFEGPVFPPAYSLIDNPDSDYTWEAKNVTGSNGGPTTAIFVDNYFYDTNGEQDAFLTVPVDLGSAQEVFLNFDVAYAYYDTDLFDGLRVEISDDCGGSFNTVLFEKYGAELATAGIVTTVFSPNGPNQWRKETIDISAFAGHTIVLKFTNINGYGNSMYLDNINVYAVAPPIASFEVSSVETCVGQTITFNSTSTGPDLVYAWNFGTNASPSTSTSGGPVNVVFNATGTFEATLSVSNSFGQSETSQPITVNAFPSPSFLFSVTDATVTFTNTSELGDSYFWDFGDMETSDEENPVHTYANPPGIFDVTLTATNDCGEVDISVPVEILYNSTSQIERHLQTSVSPNPTTGMFNLIISTDHSENLQLELFDMKGVLFLQRKLLLQAGSTTLPVNGSQLPAGLYLLKISGDSGAKAIKVVVQ
ncbi:MAG: S8 family serine peptidase [Lewinellaceae bacterium]|nr:S8 family serine peptidase [Saprospiraceae bacterium]MCB9340146.1 S8 family serine peptidase [Lewinellaceae bacterium]